MGHLTLCPACQGHQLTGFPQEHKDLPSDPGVAAPVAVHGSEAAGRAPGAVCMGGAGCQLPLSWRRRGAKTWRPRRADTWSQGPSLASPCKCRRNLTLVSSGLSPFNHVCSQATGSYCQEGEQQVPHPPPNRPQLTCNPGQEATDHQGPVSPPPHRDFPNKPMMTDRPANARRWRGVPCTCWPERSSPPGSPWPGWALLGTGRSQPPATHKEPHWPSTALTCPRAACPAGVSKLAGACEAWACALHPTVGKAQGAPGAGSPHST